MLKPPLKLSLYISSVFHPMTFFRDLKQKLLLSRGVGGGGSGEMGEGVMFEPRKIDIHPSGVGGCFA